ncbi:MAG: polyprenyl diphosphate synthase [Patescibacteria group bacterium]
MSTKIPTVPKHVGFIMDGNRRWAKSQGLSSLRGHQQGRHTFKRVLEWCLRKGINVVTVFAFSNENWNRPKQEIGYLMRLCQRVIKDELGQLHAQNIKFNVLGRLEQLPIALQQQLREAMEVTKQNTKAVLNLALNYGGRAELVDAFKRMVAGGVDPAQITEATITQNLYDGSLPDPDLIIRTSGEQRTSGFLLWEAAYAELYFTNKRWPELSDQDLDKALADYAKRKRNFGA